MSDNTLDDQRISFSQRAKQLEEERKRVWDEKGYKEFFKFPEGESTKIKVLTNVLPRQAELQGKTKTIYRISVEGTEYDCVFARGVEQEVLEGIAKGKDSFTVIRVGEGTDTRYSVKG
jgi:hypothetical protein